MPDAGQNLVQLVYSSAARMPYNTQRLFELLDQSRGNNARLGVTGMLLHDNGSFFQVLEGRAEVVERLFERISENPDHHRISRVVQMPISRRSFPEWTMGCAEVTSDELASIPGLNDFFGTGHSFTDLNESQAKQLLAAFRDGRWRNTLSNVYPDPDEPPPRQNKQQEGRRSA